MCENGLTQGTFRPMVFTKPRASYFWHTWLARRPPASRRLINIYERRWRHAKEKEFPNGVSLSLALRFRFSRWEGETRHCLNCYETKYEKTEGIDPITAEGGFMGKSFLPKRERERERERRMANDIRA